MDGHGLGDAVTLIESQLKTIVGRANTSVRVTLYSSAQGMSALASATNIAYHEPSAGSSADARHSAVRWCMSMG